MLVCYSLPDREMDGLIIFSKPIDDEETPYVLVMDVNMCLEDANTSFPPRTMLVEATQPYLKGTISFNFGHALFCLWLVRSAAHKPWHF